MQVGYLIHRVMQQKQTTGIGNLQGKCAYEWSRGDPYQSNAHKWSLHPAVQKGSGSSMLAGQETLN